MDLEGRVYEFRYEMRYLPAFTSPSSLATELCRSLDWVPTPGLYHRPVTEALLWPFLAGVFPSGKVGERWPAASLTHASACSAAWVCYWCVLAEGE